MNSIFTGKVEVDHESEDQKSDDSRAKNGPYPVLSEKKVLGEEGRVHRRFQGKVLLLVQNHEKLASSKDDEGGKKLAKSEALSSSGYPGRNIT